MAAKQIGETYPHEVFYDHQPLSTAHSQGTPDKFAVVCVELHKMELVDTLDKWVHGTSAEQDGPCPFPHSETVLEPNYDLGTTDVDTPRPSRR